MPIIKNLDIETEHGEHCHEDECHSHTHCHSPEESHTHEHVHEDDSGKAVGCAGSCYVTKTENKDENALNACKPDP
ncbi:hypothetical protein [Desulfomonile tiedjei]|uniref:hypothetical protein n=1 Tax=Desulfomonile tiedjei TaxID=2358 RepID=UPI0012FC395E|nr:hypothetical protein [Desulfomonile tiedjei]